MTVGQIKSAIARYLEKDTEFTKNGVDLLLIALNNARLQAERRHDFKHLWDYGKLLIPAGESGVNLSAATDTSDASVRVKTPMQFYRRVTLGDMPIRTMKKSALANLLTQRFDREIRPDEDGFEDDTSQYELYHNRLLISGNKVFFNPAPTEQIELRLDYVKWAAAYTSDSDTDFFTEQCHDYLIFQGVVECNHLTGTFTYRTEGNLPPPDKYAATLLEMIIEQDKHSESAADSPELWN
jgi:hypothetical protein